MESEIDDLKQEVEELKALTVDTNHQIRKMRRSQRLHTIFTIVWWLTIVGVTGAAYYYYVQPYVQKIMDTYGDAQNFQSQVEDWFSQFRQNNDQ